MKKQPRLSRSQLLQQLRSEVPRPNTPWGHVQAWFKFSETIFLARTEVFVGFVTAVVGLLDWSPLMGMDLTNGFSKPQTIALGSLMIIKGVCTELARRHNSDIS